MGKVDRRCRPQVSPQRGPMVYPPRSKNHLHDYTSAAGSGDASRNSYRTKPVELGLYHQEYRSAELPRARLVPGSRGPQGFRGKFLRCP